MTLAFEANCDGLVGPTHSYVGLSPGNLASTRNAGEVIDKLTLLYNRTRQAQITKELIEIISGAEAL